MIDKKLQWLNSQAEQNSEVLAFGSCILPETLPNADRLDEWLKRGFNAEMGWMERTAEIRKHPAANTAWLALWKYPRPLSPNSEPIAAFAHGRDYHISIGETLREWAKEVGGHPFTDSFPVAERELALLAGLGFIGRNTMLINSKFGSAFFIGGMLVGEASPSPAMPSASAATNLALAAAFTATPSAGGWQAKPAGMPPATPPKNCRRCRRCIDSCPGNAISEDGFLDARKCSSYLTIEHRGDFTEEQKKIVSENIFGCDICQRVCPYNARHLKETAPYFSPELVKNCEWKKSIIKNTPLFRAGLKNLRRNSGFPQGKPT